MKIMIIRIPDDDNDDDDDDVNDAAAAADDDGDDAHPTRHWRIDIAGAGVWSTVVGDEFQTASGEGCFGAWGDVLGICMLCGRRSHLMASCGCA